MPCLLNLSLKVCQEMEKIIRNFVWGNSDERKGINLVKWEDLSHDVKNGGLGFKILFCLNNALLMKVRFNLLKKSDQLWVQVLKGKYKWNEKIPFSLNIKNASFFWKGIGGVWSMIWDGIL